MHGKRLHSCRWQLLIIHTSCSHHLEQVLRALLEAKADPNKATKLGTTALIKACENGHELCARALLENGADLEKQNAEGMSALIWACFNGHAHVVHLLLEAGARKDVSSQFGTALALAQRNQHTAICKLLEG